MAGIYIHIPFCKTRCAYCDFYSTTHEAWKQQYIDAVCKELVQRKDYLKGETVDTIYMGGGTPSQLSIAQLNALLATIEAHFPLSKHPEITIEVNPDDVSDSYAEELKQTPVNRISMGIQTFDDATLRILNRRHTEQIARMATMRLREKDFQNISIDLMYGLPGETIEQWENDLQQAIALNVEHISAYHLTYEEGTPLYRRLQAGEVSEVNEELSLTFFNMLIDALTKAGYLHYEISNFCKPGMHSRHNSSYWKGIAYLGCGAAAHSFDGTSRQWNVADIKAYIKGIETNAPCYEIEALDTPTQYNEYIMTGLRTSHGISFEEVTERFGQSFATSCKKSATPHLESGKLITEGHRIKLSREGIFVSDAIICDLMVLT